MKKTYRYFAYSHNTGLDTYETADEAKNAAEESLQAYRDVADDGWDEDVTGVCWGEIRQETVELPTGELINDYGDYVAEYELRDVVATGTKEYSDGTTATGSEPLPELSPRQQDTRTALGMLTAIESMHGRSGVTISLRGLIERLGA